MKIAYLLPPAHGHLNPAVPVMRELARRGDQVTAYDTEEFRPKIERAGATFRAYSATDFSASELSRVLEDGNLANATGLILRGSEQLLPFVLEELAREKPDLVVFDSIALWGKIAATKLRLRAAASISHLIMDERHLPPVDLLRLLGQHLPRLPVILRARRRLIERYGDAYPPRPLFPMRDRLNVVFTTRDLQPDAAILDDTFHFVGPSIDPQTRSESFPFEALGPGPVVYVSMGTVHVLQPELCRAFFAAFAGVSAQFIVSAGRLSDLGGVGATPANFLVRESVPQLEVLERASVFVTHAGINSVHEALYHGVPMVLIPHQFEQLLNARRVAALGAGVVIEERVRRKPVTASRLREALDTVRSEGRYLAAAKVLQQSMRSGGGYREAADLLQAHGRLAAC